MTFSHRLIAYLAAFSLVLNASFPNGVVALATQTEIAPASQEFDTASLLRTVVQVDNQTMLKRVTDLGVVMLKPPVAPVQFPVKLSVLVSGDQLERLVRAGLRPVTADELGLLVSRNGKSESWLGNALSVMMNHAKAAQAQVNSKAADAKDLIAELNGELQRLTQETKTAINALTSVDDDADGLTNTQEAWWCTNPLSTDSDGDGASDPLEVQQAKDWVGNLRAGPPATGKPFLNWPMLDNGGNNPNCPDSDRDGVPDLAETWELGLNPNLGSTSHDRYLDGRKLYGNLPATLWGRTPPVDDLLDNLPSWVLFPGNHPVQAAHPQIEIDIEPTSLWVQAVTTLTTDKVISQGTTKNYNTTKTTGASSSESDTTTWNEWQETSTAISSRLGVSHDIAISDSAIRDNLLSDPQIVPTPPQYVPKPSSGGVGPIMSYGSLPVPPIPVPAPTPPPPDMVRQDSNTTKATNIFGYPTECGEWVPKIKGSVYAGIGGSFKIIGGGAEGSFETEYRINDAVYENNKKRCLKALAASGQLVEDEGSGSVVYEDSSGQLVANRLFEISKILAAPVKTTTETKGKSWGGAHTVEHTRYDEIAVQEGSGLSQEQSWSNATAIDSAHSADFWFTYNVENKGSDVARQVCQLQMNIYLGDNKNPIRTYPAFNDFGTSGCLSFVKQNELHQFTTSRIPLSLEELKLIETGAKLRVVIQHYTLGNDDQFLTDAQNSSVLIAIEDGTGDGDEAIDTYLIPTWGDGDTMQNVIGRYFPHTQDSDGNYIAIWTPENIAPSVNTLDLVNDAQVIAAEPGWCVEPRRASSIAPQVWCKHALSTSDWWNIYLNNLGDGTSQLNQTLAAPNSTAFFRFNKDSDLDGYSDRTEEQMGTNPDDAASHPKPELLAGVNRLPAVNNMVTATASLLNTGLYDAYGVELIMVAPNDSITILNNTVGGSGRVKAGKQVIVGSSTKIAALPAAWAQTGHAKPSPGGYYTGGADRVYTFTASCANPGGCDVGNPSNAPTLNWSDGAGGTGALSLGSYSSPSLLNVGLLGVQLSMQSGKIYNNETFSMTASTPRDTFSYRINQTPYTDPLVIVSYNDPQGNHRFIIPSSAMSLTTPTQNLAVFGGQMLQDPGVEIATTTPFTPTGAQSVTLVINNPTGVTLTNAHLFLEFVNISGTVAAEFPATTTLPAGPSVVTMNWNMDVFSPTFAPSEDYIVMAFFTDYQGNILDTGGRPLSSFQQDPKPVFAMGSADQTWNFGTAAQGTLLKRTFTFGNVGLLDLLTYVSGVPGLSLSQTGSRKVGPADVTTYEMALNTQGMAVGPYDQTITIRTSDPAKPTQAVHIVGTITAGTADTAGQGVRPWDVNINTTGVSAGTWMNYTMPADGSPSQLHPMFVRNLAWTTLFGTGRYATDFASGTSSADLFGDGRDGAMPGSGDLNNNNGQGYGKVNSGSVGTTILNVTDVAYDWRINPGDKVFIHQTQGSNAGCWEVNSAASDFAGGTENVTLQKPLACNYYSDSGNNHAQIVRVPQYTTCNVTGTVTPFTGWNGIYGGILAVMCRDGMTVSGMLNVSSQGYQGTKYTGTVVASDGSPANSGEGQFQPGFTNSSGYVTNPNGMGGGAGGWKSAHGGPPPERGGGGGGAYATAGGEGGWCCGYPQNRGLGGTVDGSPDLSRILFGGAGGGGGGDRTNANNTWNNARGGNGGGIIYVSANGLNVSGSILSNGEQGERWPQIPNIQGDGGNGGGGAGGSIFLRARNLSVAQNISANGGLGANPGNSFVGGNGGVGRIRLEYCESVSGSTNPPASTQKLTCHIAEQTETAPYNTGRLNVPNNASNPVNITHGKRLVFSGAGSQDMTLRVPAGLVNGIWFTTFLSNAPNATNIKLDVGANGSNEWDDTRCNNCGLGTDQYPSYVAAIVNAINLYWISQGKPTTGYLDVPIRVTSGGAGQWLIGEQGVNIAGAINRYIRLPARAYSSVIAQLAVNGGSGASTIGVDVGANGSIDWAWNGAAPSAALNANLTSFVNAYLSGKTGDVDVPIRIYQNIPSGSVSLTNFTATPSQLPDATSSASNITFSSSTIVESDAVTVTATVNNAGASETTGLIASFSAVAPGIGSIYLGSAFVPALAAGGSAQVSVPWSTLGFTGSIPVRLSLDPAGRVTETNESNNVFTITANILTRPDLQITSLALSDEEPNIGELVTVTAAIKNKGQTSAPVSALGVYLGNADSGLLLNSQSVALSAGNVSTLTFTWTPTETGSARLFARADRNRQVNESDTANNDLWIDRHISVGGGYDIDSGVALSDTAYSEQNGAGTIDSGQPDSLESCGSTPDDTYRRAPDGAITYRFDHLNPSRFYHLDISMRACAVNSQRKQDILVDGNVITTNVDLNDNLPHYISFLLDPALYADRSIIARITAPASVGAVISRISVREVMYRYVDAGANTGTDLFYTAARGYGWLAAYDIGTACGSLPGQTARVNQIGDRLQYRFDGLNPAKRYKAAVTIYQCTGSAVIQKLDMDGNIVGADLVVQSGQPYVTTRRVPLSLYQGDGSIVLSIIRTNSTINAMVSEISLEEETVSTNAGCSGYINMTPYATQVFGSVYINGQPAPVGTIVTAEDPRGDVVGCMDVKTAGLYPYMFVYGEDASASPAVGGMRAGEPVRFRVDGVLAVGTPLLQWQNDSNQHRVDLNAGITSNQAMLLKSGWNFISFRVEPPVPLVDNVLDSISGKYCRVLGMNATSNCALAPEYRALKELHPGNGYFLHITNTTSVFATVEGLALPADRPIALNPGWNWIGYYPTATLPISVALGGIAGKYARVLSLDSLYNPTEPDFSTLAQMETSKGYRIFITSTAPITLVYPGVVMQAGADGGIPIEQSEMQPNSSTDEICAGVQPTPKIAFVYGRLGGGAGMSAGTKVEAITPDGEIAGCVVTSHTGRYGYMAVFGKEGAIPGFLAGQTIRLRINGIVRDTGVVWADNSSANRFDVADIRMIFLPDTRKSFVSGW